MGAAFAAFALATSVGDIVGGSLSEHHRTTACLLGGGLSLAALLSLVLLGWEETAPESIAGDRAREDAVAGAEVDNGERRRRWRRSDRPKLPNPMSVLVVFLENRCVICFVFFSRLALVLFCAVQYF